MKTFTLTHIRILRRTGRFILSEPTGDPELITVKGKRLIDEADIIIYAGSLVNPQVLSWGKAGG